MTWTQGNTQTLLASQQVIDQEASLSTNSREEQARPVRLVDPLSQDITRLQKSPSRKRKRWRPLPLPIIQMSQALPCLLCHAMTMTAIVDLNARRHDPWP